MEHTQKRPNTRRDRVISLRRAELTYAEIGRQLGMSRERARQLSKAKPPKPTLESKAIVTAGEAAQLIGVHASTLRRWNKRGY